MVSTQNTVQEESVGATLERQRGDTNGVDAYERGEGLSGMNGVGGDEVTVTSERHAQVTEHTK